MPCLHVLVRYLRTYGTFLRTRAEGRGGPSVGTRVLGTGNGCKPISHSPIRTAPPGARDLTASVHM